MSSGFYLFIAIAALVGLAFFCLKWLAARREGARKAAALGKAEKEIGSLRGRAEDRQLFEGLLDEISQGFLIVSRNLEVSFANKAAAALFPALNGSESRRVVEVLMDHRLVQVAHDAIEGGGRRSREVRVRGAARGSEEPGDRVFEIEAAPLPGDSDAGCWVMIRDVTERVVTEQVRKDFVANASHELRTPLTLINGYVETLEDGLIDDREAAMKSLAVMHKHGKRIMRIVEDMLTISKLESSDSTLRLKEFDLGACVADVVEHLGPLVGEKEAEIECDISESERSMMGDRFYWDQIFINLIENALKQNQRPGLKVTVRSRCVGAQRVIEVCDDGVGIPRADVPFVFKRFYRAAKHHSKEIKGTGLGLSIVKRAVEAHGGTVAVESQPGIETLFQITVPLSERGKDGS